MTYTNLIIDEPIDDERDEEELDDYIYPFKQQRDMDDIEYEECEDRKEEE